MHKLEYLIFEAEEEEEGEAPAGEAEEEEPVGSEKIDAEEPAEEQSPNIDIDRFTDSVARLIMNPENLLKVDAVILNRAKNYLKEKNYDQSYVDKMLEKLNSKFDIKIVDNLRDYNENPPEHDAPFSVGAYDAGSGGAGA